MAVALAVGCLTGCDLDGRFVINADDTVDAEIQVWDHADTSWTDANGNKVTYTPKPCAGVQRYAPGLTTTETVDPANPSRVGCHATGRIPLADLTKTASVARLEDHYVVLVGLKDIQALQITSNTTLPNADSSKLSITFPGPVLSHSANSVVEGNTVRWVDATKWVWQPIEVVASVPGAPDWQLPAAVAGGGALAGLALGVVGWRRASRRWVGDADAPDAAEDADEPDEPLEVDAAGNPLHRDPSAEGES